MVEKGTIVELKHLRSHIIREALQDHGCIVSNEENPDTRIIWWDGYIPIDEFANLKPYQRINKIPQMDELCYKSTLFQSLNQMQHLFPLYYSFFPETFLLPQQFIDFSKEHIKLSTKLGNNLTWIFKPRSGCCGNGIKLIQNPSVLSNETAPGVIQRYVSPFLIGGYKFDFRVYLMISSLSPFTIYIFKDGLARFCTSKYSPPSQKNLDNKFCHITNTAVNIENKKATNDYTRLLSDVLKEVEPEPPKGEGVWEKIKRVSILTLLAIYPQMIGQLPPLHKTPRLESFQFQFAKTTTKTSGMLSSTLPASSSIFQQPTAPQAPHYKPVSNKYFHICGIDILLDSNANPIVLELNDRPSMKVQFECEKQLKHDLVYDALKIITLDGNPPKEPLSPDNRWEKIYPPEETNPMASSYRSMQQRAVNVFGPKQTIIRSTKSQKAIIYPKIVPDKLKVLRQNKFNNQ